MDGTTYLMVLPVAGYPLDGTRFAVESAFAEHLRSLRDHLGPLAEDLVVAGPRMSAEAFEAGKAGLDVLDEASDGIRFRGLFPAGLGRFGYLRRLPGVLRELYRLVKDARVVHAGGSPLFRPFEFPALLMARLLGRKTVYVVDIDNRESAAMNLRTRSWSRREYWTTRLLHDSVWHLQSFIAVRAFSLVLFKGAGLVRDYGGGRPHVKNFLDSAFGERHTIPAEPLKRKIHALRDPARPVELAYAGRLVPYKGVDHMLRAVAAARSAGAGPLRMHVVGDGPERRALERLGGELGLGEELRFHGTLPFGDELFRRMRDFHLLLAAPLRQDTPRSALDALASGQALVAYDTYYYRELRQAGAPVDTVPWLDVGAMGRVIAGLCADREALAGRLARAVDFARANTQEAWLERRVRWTREILEGGP